MQLRDAEGKRFTIHKVMRDGTACGTCKRIIRVREQAAFYAPDGPWVCRDCLYGQPLTEHNQWRRDAKKGAA